MESGPKASMASAIATNRSVKVVATSSQASSLRASSKAIFSMDRQKNAIQLVASDCSSTQPSGTSCDRSNTEMLSMPRKPPSNSWEPLRSVRFTPQPQFSISLVKPRPRNSRSQPPSAMNTCQAAHACTGGFTSPKSHS